MARAPSVVLAGFEALFACAYTLCSGGTCVTGAGLASCTRAGSVATFIDIPITVIVELVIAELLVCGFDFTVTTSPLSGVTSLCATFTRADPVGVGGACIAVS